MTGWGRGVGGEGVGGGGQETNTNKNKQTRRTIFTVKSEGWVGMFTNYGKGGKCTEHEKTQSLTVLYCNDAQTYVTFQLVRTRNKQRHRVSWARERAVDKNNSQAHAHKNRAACSSHGQQQTNNNNLTPGCSKILVDKVRISCPSKCRKKGVWVCANRNKLDIFEAKVRKKLLAGSLICQITGGWMYKIEVIP